MNWQELSDRELVRFCVRPDKDGWAELLRRYRNLIAGVAAKTIRLKLRLPNMESDVEDVVHEALERLCKDDFRAFRELEWRHEGSLRGLLRVTASTAAMDHVTYLLAGKRDPRREESLEEEKNQNLPAKDAIAVKIEYKIFVEQLARCLTRVTGKEPDSSRNITIYLLYFWYGVTARDISRLYKLDVRKVENTVARLSRIARVHCQ